MENSRVTVAQFSALTRDWRSVHSDGGTKAKMPETVSWTLKLELGCLIN